MTTTLQVLGGLKDIANNLFFSEYLCDNNPPGTGWVERGLSNSSDRSINCDNNPPGTGWVESFIQTVDSPSLKDEVTTTLQVLGGLKGVCKTTTSQVWWVTTTLQVLGGLKGICWKL